MTSNHQVEGSNPSGITNFFRVYSEDMVYSLFRRHGLHFLRGEWVCSRFNAALSNVEESQIIAEEGYKPDPVIDLACRRGERATVCGADCG